MRGKSRAAPGGTSSSRTRSRAGYRAGEGPDGAGAGAAVWRRQGQRLGRNLSSSAGVEGRRRTLRTGRGCTAGERGAGTPPQSRGVTLKTDSRGCMKKPELQLYRSERRKRWGK